jgi:transcriptional regulator with PAS, ATPase and Fis domain
MAGLSNDTGLSKDTVELKLMYYSICCLGKSLIFPPPHMSVSRTSASDHGPPIAGLIGSCAAMEEVYRITRRVAKTNASVLLLGETGTGKELIATAIHKLSDRGTGPFVKVNCGALSESLLESELFGHVRGAFTGAVNNRTGRFEAAHAGSIFLDEINSTSLFLQVKLLRVLQEREFERVGDTNTIRVDTRVIAASNRSLADEVEAGRFREDLYWRLNVVPIMIPPLRKRRDDIPALVSHFLAHYSESNEKYVVHIQQEALAALQDYDWPGNVRELQNYVERAVVMSEGDELTLDLLPDTVLHPSPRRRSAETPIDFPTLVREVVQTGLTDAGPQAENVHERIVNQVEKEVIVQVMESCGGTQTKAATRLGINRNTLHKKMKEYNLDVEPE